MKAPVDVLWCGSNPKRMVDGWAFPAAVRKLLVRENQGLSVLQLFGGRADFGTKLDIDPMTNPHVIGDAWLPPFAKDSFDVVVMDPPYIGKDYASMSNQKTRALFAAAAWIARRRVVWFSPIWIESPARCVLERAWLVRVGRQCIVRCLQFFTVAESERKLPPVKFFSRGPAMKYNRWLRQPEMLRFPRNQESDEIRDALRLLGAR
jgi:hypothetical protein